jgi:hypothetical protein
MDDDDVFRIGEHDPLVDLDDDTDDEDECRVCRGPKEEGCVPMTQTMLGSIDKRIL